MSGILGQRPFPRRRRCPRLVVLFVERQTQPDNSALPAGLVDDGGRLGQGEAAHGREKRPLVGMGLQPFVQKDAELVLDKGPHPAMAVMDRQVGPAVFMTKLGLDVPRARSWRLPDETRRRRRGRYRETNSVCERAPALQRARPASTHSEQRVPVRSCLIRLLRDLSLLPSIPSRARAGHPDRTTYRRFRCIAPWTGGIAAPPARA